MNPTAVHKSPSNNATVDSAFRAAAGAYEASIAASPRAWRTLFHNVDCAIEELYIFCENEGSENLCQESFNMLLKNARDFSNLIDRFYQQRSFDNHTKHSVSWEVRKPTSTMVHGSGSNQQVEVVTLKRNCYGLCITVCLLVCDFIVSAGK